jgi:hypothetical protein
MTEEAKKAFQMQDVYRRRKLAKGYRSTVLTGGTGIETPQTFLSSVLGG